MDNATILEVTGEQLPDHLDALTEILRATVTAGASVGFILPFPAPAARAFWIDHVAPALAGGRRHLFIATLNGRAVATIQLDHNFMPNQAHRCEVAKLLVHPDHRGLGIAGRLLAVLENRARGLGKTLITLDTRSGDTAQRLYQRHGFLVAGEIPDYCRAPDAERLEGTTYMYKRL